MQRLTAGLLASLLLAWAPAQAETGRGVTGDEALAVLQAMDLGPQLREDGVGDPMIAFELEGLNAFMNFYDCDQGRCGSLQLLIGLDLEHGTSLQVANVYNSRYRYGRLSLDDEMDPFLTYDFEVLHAQHAAHIRSQVELFGQLLGDFTSAVGF
jgi:hypothetical protein